MSKPRVEVLALYLSEAVCQIDSFWMQSPTPQRWFNGETRKLYLDAIEGKSASNPESQPQTPSHDACSFNHSKQLYDCETDEYLANTQAAREKEQGR